MANKLKPGDKVLFKKEYLNKITEEAYIDCYRKPNGELEASYVMRLFTLLKPYVATVTNYGAYDSKGKKYVRVETITPVGTTGSYYSERDLVKIK